jgi:hypothetical protein
MGIAAIKVWRAPLKGATISIEISTKVFLSSESILMFSLYRAL